MEIAEFERRANTVVEGFKFTPKQLECVRALEEHQHSANFSDVGTGKTAISTLISLRNGADITLVISIPTTLTQWDKWLQVFAPTLLYKGTPETRKKLSFNGKRFVVMSHSIFRNDFQHVIHLCRGKLVEIIVDEADPLRSVSNILYKRLKAIVQDINLQMLTATPVNKPVDAYGFISLKNKSKPYKTLRQFENLHVTKRDFFDQPIEYRDLQTVSKHLYEQAVKYNKLDMFGVDLKPMFVDCEYDLDPAHKKLYKQMVQEQLDEIVGVKVDAMSANAIYHACQQVICNYAHFSSEPSNRSAVFDVIDETVHETQCLDVARSKLIIWTIYKITSKSVLSYLQGKGINAVGAFSGEKSTDSTDSFVNNPDVRILVANPQSAGIGLNPQYVCNEALVLELPTSPRLVRQMLGRIDRMGQKNKPRTKFAVASGTLQAKAKARLLKNDDTLAEIVPAGCTDKSLRELLLG